MYLYLLHFHLYLVLFTYLIVSYIYIYMYLFICIYMCLRNICSWKFQVATFLYSADLSSKNVFVEAKFFLYAETMHLLVFLWLGLLIVSDRLGS